MKQKAFLKMSLFSIAGAVLGFGYYYFIGCRTGSCPITSNPFISTGYGFLMGLVLGFDTRLFKKSSATPGDSHHE